MCRLATIPKVTDETRDNAWAMAIALSDIMSKNNDDGLGYAAFDKAGNIFGERWLVNKMGFTDFSNIKGLTPERTEKIYNYFGEKVLRKEAQGIILHARAATCDKNLKNTHPFINDQDKITSAIVHNGVIVNHMDHEKKTSTCDSEVLVHLYEKFKVRENLDNIKYLVQEIRGWYTVLNLTKDSTDRMIIDIYTDAPRISSYFVKELDTRVYSTSADDIQEAAEIFGFHISDRQTAKPNMAYRIDVLTGECIESCTTFSRAQKFMEFLTSAHNRSMLLSEEQFKQDFLNKTNA